MVAITPSLPVLKISDLKHPFIDEDAQFLMLPKPNNHILASNHIYKVVSEPEIEPLRNYPPFVIKRYNSARKTKNLPFAKWYVKDNENSDTFYYDKEGRPFFYLFPNIMTVAWRYTYDSNGYVSDIRGGSCTSIAIHYKYYFSEKKRILYKIKFNHRHDIPDAYIFFLTILTLPDYDVFEFDSNGYLQTIVERKGYPWLFDSYLRTYKLKYTANHKIDLIIDHTKYNDSFVSKCVWDDDSRIANNQVSKYHYVDDKLSSITTTSTFHDRFPYYVRNTKTYFNESELVKKRIHINYRGKFFSKSTIYKYIYY